MAPSQVDRQTLYTLWPKYLRTVGVDDDRHLAFWRQVKRKLDYLESSGELGNIMSNDILWIICKIRQQKDLPRQEVIEAVKQHFVNRSLSNYALSTSVDLATGIWIHVKVQSRAMPPSSGWLQWNDGQSLMGLLEEGFRANADLEADSGGILNRELTVERLVSDYKVRVSWTDNLIEHLSWNPTSRVLTVYEHKICLWNHLKSGDESALPQRVVGEAIDTLNLLFPLDDRPTNSFLGREKKRFNQLGACGRERTLELGRYAIWRERLWELGRVLDEEPGGYRQLLLMRDGRNALQFATFWVASVVAILTIISLVTGVVSVTYAKRAYEIAQAQYDFSIAEVCAEPEKAAQLKSWCRKS